MTKRRNRTWATESTFSHMLNRYKITGWIRQGKLPGRPDFVFPRRQVAVFIDGDFWHGHPSKFRLPASNSAYWQSRIESTRRRDSAVTAKLKKMGWAVVRIWESSLRDEEAVIAKLKLLL
jgi:DNA mismatch endonuclease (patch repair protein)